MPSGRRVRRLWMKRTPPGEAGSICHRALFNFIGPPNGHRSIRSGSVFMYDCVCVCVSAERDPRITQHKRIYTCACVRACSVAPRESTSIGEDRWSTCIGCRHSRSIGRRCNDATTRILAIMSATRNDARRSSTLGLKLDWHVLFFVTYLCVPGLYLTFISARHFRAGISRQQTVWNVTLLCARATEIYRFIRHN